MFSGNGGEQRYCSASNVQLSLPGVAGWVLLDQLGVFVLSYCNFPSRRHLVILILYLGWRLAAVGFWISRSKRSIYPIAYLRPAALTTT